MRVSTILLLSSLALPAAAETPKIAEHPEVAGALALVDAWVDSVQSYKQVPGISVGFVVDQELIFSKGYGYSNVGGKVPADENTIYSVCSISKLFTSIGVMQMRDASKLALRDPVAKHLDWYDIQETFPEAGPARIEGLLTHSSGLPRESDFPYWVQPDHPFPDRAAMMDQLSAQSTLYPAETRFQYSNLGLTLAGEIIEAHAGTPFADYVTTQILAPIGLNNTRPYFPADLQGQEMAIGYTGMTRAHKRDPVPPFDTKAIAPAAGFTSTVADLGRFASWNFSTLAGNGNDVLDANTLREMQRVHWVNPDWKVTWGLGFLVREAEGETLVGHSGACPGFITNFVMVPKHKLAVIALTNASDGPAGKISEGMLKVIGSALQKMGGDGGTDEPLPDFSKFEGNYSGGVWGGEIAFRQMGRKLAGLFLPTDDPSKFGLLKHVEGNTFVRIENQDENEERETAVFVTDADGNVTGVKFHSNTRSKL